MDKELILLKVSLTIPEKRNNPYPFISLESVQYLRQSRISLNKITRKEEGEKQVF